MEEANDIIAQLKNIPKEAKQIAAKKDMEPLEKEEVEQFIIDQSAKLIKDSMEMIDNMKEVVFEDLGSLKIETSRLLMENHLIWENYGPESKIAKGDPGSNAYIIWEIRKLGAVIPNNQKIINMIETNIKLLPTAEYKAFIAFKNHAISFEANQYCRASEYSLFPNEFSEIFQ